LWYTGRLRGAKPLFPSFPLSNNECSMNKDKRFERGIKGVSEVSKRENV
jgi:hypothetical protein